MGERGEIDWNGIAVVMQRDLFVVEASEEQ